MKIIKKTATLHLQSRRFVLKLLKNKYLCRH